MKRLAFLLGLYSVGGQVLLLRELISSFNGDELFIGTALFGWLIAVAVGAHLGGKGRFQIGVRLLFVIGAFLLPLLVIAARLAPLLISDVIGEVIPFSTAAFLSVILMLPVGIISGWLFPTIARRGEQPTDTIVLAYLYEGLGAFAGSLAILLIAGTLLSTLAVAFILGIVAIAGACYSASRWKVAYTLISLPAIAAVILLVPQFDLLLEEAKFPAYKIEESFDTPYGHQVLLSRDSSMVLITDNRVEATYPNQQQAEELLVPPLLYKPDATTILVFGRAEFSVSQLSDSFPNLQITAVDPRATLSPVIDQVVPTTGSLRRINDDPVSFLARRSQEEYYDIIILQPGEPDTYRSSSLLTETFLKQLKRALAHDGLLYCPMNYDTERYISLATAKLVSVIHNVFQGTFAKVALWPGSNTPFFATDGNCLNLSLDTLLNRINHLGYTPRYLSEDFLADRLSEFRIERLQAALDSSATPNSVKRPILLHHQIAWRARADALEAKLMATIFRAPYWFLAVPLMFLAFFLRSVVGKGKERRFALFLLFVAGVVSLSLELLSFYLYQSTAGSLYSRLAILIGTFMLGLAFGTYSSHKAGARRVEYPALALLLVAGLVFLTTYDIVPIGAVFAYHLLFLFVVATATGGIFVGATNRFYQDQRGANRGFGYAFEVAGSSLGTLLSATILLPLLGLDWLLLALIALVAVALIGALLTSKG